MNLWKLKDLSNEYSKTDPMFTSERLSLVTGDLIKFSIYHTWRKYIFFLKWLLSKRDKTALHINAIVIQDL